MTILNRTETLALNAELDALAHGSFTFAQVDPYLKWALLSQFEGYRGWPGGQLPFLLYTQKDPYPASGLDNLSIVINGAYVSPAGGNNRYAWAKFSTALVERNNTTDLATLHHQIVTLREGACKLGLPATSVPYKDIPGTPAGLTSSPVLAIIDHALAFGNRSFQQPNNNTRIQALWDQDSQSLPGPFGTGLMPATWSAQNTFGYGRVITSTNIDFASEQFPHEEKLYAAATYKAVWQRAGHGTHVLDLAVGNTKSPPDKATQVGILAVQLPWRPFKDTSGASLCVHVLDALQWFRLSTDPDQPLVVNISDGAYAGPGKGRSLLERAMVNFVGLDSINGTPKTHLVIAAGNGALRRGRSYGILDTAQPKSAPLIFRVLPDTPTDTFLEIWIDSAHPLGDYQDHVTIALVAPSGEKITVSKASELAAIVSTGNQPMALLCASTQSPDSPNHLGFLVAISPTKQKNAHAHRATSPHGLWSLEIENTSNASIEYRALIQRSNPALGDKGIRREAEFIRTGPASTRLPEEDTLNNIATGSDCIVVGGYVVKQDDWPDPRTPTLRDPQARYSSRGDYSTVLGGRLVDVIAPSDESTILHGILASGVRSGTKVRMNGTSVAAPQVARALVNALARSGNGTPSDINFLLGQTIVLAGANSPPPKLR